MQILPRPLGQVLGDTMNALARVWRPLTTTALLVFVPVGLLTLLLFRTIDGATDFLDLVFTDSAALESLTNEQLLEAARPFFTAIGLGFALQTLGTVYVYLVTARAIALDASGESVIGREVRAHALRKFGIAVIGTVIAVLVVGTLIGVGITVWFIPATLVGTPNTTSALIAFVLLIALAAPGVWIGVSFSMFLAALSTEPLGPLSALRRSFGLVKGRWWPTAGFLVLVGLLGFVAVQLIQLVAIPLVAVGSLESGVSLASVFGLVAQGLIVAGYGAMYAAWYVDLRSRKETLLAEDLSRVR